MGSGRRELQQAGLFELQDILVRRAAGVGLPAIDRQRRRAALRIGSRRALPVDDEDARPPGLRATALGYQPVGISACTTLSPHARCDHREGVDPAKRDQQPSVGQRGEPVGIESLAERRRRKRSRQGQARLGHEPPARQVDEREPVGIVLGRDQPVPRRSNSSAVGSPIVRTRPRRGSLAGMIDSSTSCRSRGDETQARSNHRPRDREREFAARNAACRRIDLAGSEVLLGDHVALARSIRLTESL